MEVIKIPWEHVDACLFFRPGREDGERPGRCTVLSARQTVGRVREEDDMTQSKMRGMEDSWENMGMSEQRIELQEDTGRVREL